VSISAYHHLAGATGWYIVRGEPIGVYKDAIWKPVRALASGGLVVLLLALVAAYLISRRILLPMRMLTRQAEATAASGGEAVFAHQHSSRVTEFEHMSRAVHRADATLRARAAEVADMEARLRAVVDTAVDAIVVIDDAGIVQSFNRAAEAIFGYTAKEAIGRNVSFLVAGGHAGRHDDYLAAYLRSGCQRMVGTHREVEGRRKDGTTVPIDISVAEWRDARGRRFFTGIMRDISGHKADEARRVLLMREVDHRAKNILAVVQSVLRLTPREEPHAFVAAVQARVAALARAHSLLAEAGWFGADLRALVECELAPYGSTRDTAATKGATILLDGPPISLAPAAVQPLAMVLHELATNAAKYGALSVPDGTVEVHWHANLWTQDDASLHLRWVETGGPAIPGDPTRCGFGTRVIGATVRGQLGGTVRFDWKPTGLVCEITVRFARVTASKGAAAE
jgi:PAS domain S-box-containing protein